MPLFPHLAIPPRNRQASNTTKRGFNDPTDSFLGFPSNMLPHVSEDEDLLDPSRNSSWFRHDLALKYYYEDVVHYRLEDTGEWVSFPLVRTVYRRDRDLRKSEIVAYLKHGEVPSRYPPRLSGGVVNEPMNADNFKLMVSRFFINNFTALGRAYEELREHSSGRIVQPTSHAFEEVFWRTVAVACHWDYIKCAYPAQIQRDVRCHGGSYWYLNMLKRCAAVGYRVLEGRDVLLPFPGCEDDEANHIS
ncbi:hypothetical protein B0H17DRAFT_1128655 [Mycena rosella]|uniref:Uncharacterized protein n=1 Tax=Mycena rosella TaxID=1033263 RepID=A0AAD7DWV5_MYCRO|nr:hypothetical protein B0H17DRAFT_1128655 [Mycena rosella]